MDPDRKIASAAGRGIAPALGAAGRFAGLALLCAAIGLLIGTGAGCYGAGRLERAAVWRMSFVDGVVDHLPGSARPEAMQCVAAHDRGNVLSLDWLDQCARAGG